MSDDRLLFAALLQEPEFKLICLFMLQDAFILETGESVYVWLGRKATRSEKSQAFKDAQVSESIHF